MTASIQITVQYFAIFREQAGCRQEVIHSTAADADALYQQLAAHHGFKLTTEQLKVAINGEFSTWQQALRSGDVVTFIPPVAGG